jgi:hypothetical protein
MHAWKQHQESTANATATGTNDPEAAIHE